MIKEKAATRVDTQIVRETLSQTYTVSANGYYEGELNVAKNGYTFIASVGFAITGEDSSNANVFKFYKVGNAMRYSVKSTSSSTKNQEIYFYCLYVKD